MVFACALFLERSFYNFLGKGLDSFAVLIFLIEILRLICKEMRREG